MPGMRADYPLGRFFLGLVVAWSVVVHLPGLTSPLLDFHAHRQTQTASMARNYVRHDMHFLNPQLDFNGVPTRAGTEFPIYSFLIALLYKLFGIHEILGRLLSIGLTAWAAVFLYKFLQNRFESSRMALLGALTVSTIPIHIYFTRTVQPEPMAMWGFLGFIYFVDRALYRGGGRIDWLWALLLGATGPLLKLPFLYLVCGLWAVFVIENLSLLRRKAMLLLPLLILAATAAWYHYAKSAPTQVLPMGIEEHFKNLQPVFTGRFWNKLFISRFPELCATYSGLLLGGIGAWTIARVDRHRRFWLGWWAVTFVYTVLCGDYGIIHQYTSLPWAPINAVFIAAGALALWDAGKASRAMRALTLILLIGIPVHAGFRIKHWYRVERDYLFRAKAYLDGALKPGELVLTATSETPVLLYYLDRYGYAVELPYTTPQQMNAWINNVQGVRFIVIPVDSTWTSSPEWSEYFRRRARLALADPEFLIYEL